MNELSSRVEAQRQILRVVNSRPWTNEQLHSLNAAAIQRWTLANNIDSSSHLVKLLTGASAQIFVMANHSDDPIASTYQITKAKVETIETAIREELGVNPDPCIS